MLTARTDQQGLTTGQGAGFGLIGELQQGTALQQQHPFVLALVVPETLRAAGAAGVDPLQPQLRGLQQHGGDFFPSGGAGAPDQGGLCASLRRSGPRPVAR